MLDICLWSCGCLFLFTHSLIVTQVLAQVSRKQAYPGKTEIPLALTLLWRRLGLKDSLTYGLVSSRVIGPVPGQNRLHHDDWAAILFSLNLYYRTLLSIQPPVYRVLRVSLPLGTYIFSDTFPASIHSNYIRWQLDFFALSYVFDSRWRLTILPRIERAFARIACERKRSLTFCSVTILYILLRFLLAKFFRNDITFIE